VINNETPTNNKLLITLSQTATFHEKPNQFNTYACNIPQNALQRANTNLNRIVLSGEVAKFLN